MLRVIIYQGSITVVVALVFMSLESANLMSSFYGGLVAVVNTLLLARSVDDAGVAAYEQKKARSALVLVRSVVMRFVIVLASFYVGIVHRSFSCSLFIIFHTLTTPESLTLSLLNIPFCFC